MGIDFAQNAFGQSDYRVACQETYDNYRHIKQHSVHLFTFNFDFVDSEISAHQEYRQQPQEIAAAARFDSDE